MNENRLGELTEQESTGMMDSVLSDEFNQMPASEFFGTLKAMRINKTKAASTSPETSEIRSLIMNEFARWHANDGALETAIPGVILYRYSAPHTSCSMLFIDSFDFFLLQATFPYFPLCEKRSEFVLKPLDFDF